MFYCVCEYIAGERSKLSLLRAAYFTADCIDYVMFPAVTAARVKNQQLPF